MASLNQCNFIGNIGSDPETRTFPNGNKMVSARLAVTERFKDREGNMQERTEWISLVFNGRLADVAEKFVTKGASIYVSGKWHTREWNDRDGNKRYSTELSVGSLELLGQKPKQENPSGGYGGNDMGF